VTVFQMCFGAVVLASISPMFHFGEWSDVRKWALVSLVWGINLATSNIALQNASLGLVMITRNCSPIITFLFEACFQEAILMSPPALMALVVMTSGVILYTYNDVSLSATGLAACFIDIFVGICAALLQRRYIAIHPVDISFGGMLLLQNALGMLPDIALLFASQEPWHWHKIVDYVPKHDENVTQLALDHPGVHLTHPWTDYAMFVLTCGLGLVMGWATINAQQYVTATTMMVMGNCNRILIIVGGAIIIGEQYTWVGVIGIVLAISGSVWYGYTRTRVVYADKKMKFLSVADNLDKLDAEGNCKSSMRRGVDHNSSANSIAGDSEYTESEANLYAATPRSPWAAAALAANREDAIAARGSGGCAAAFTPGQRATTSAAAASAPPEGRSSGGEGTEWMSSPQALLSHIGSSASRLVPGQQPLPEAAVP